MVCQDEGIKKDDIIDTIYNLSDFKILDYESWVLDPEEYSNKIYSDLFNIWNLFLSKSEKYGKEDDNFFKDIFHNFDFEKNFYCYSRKFQRNDKINRIVFCDKIPEYLRNFIIYKKNRFKNS
jgi:hypothetical protein